MRRLILFDLMSALRVRARAPLSRGAPRRAGIHRAGGAGAGGACGTSLSTPRFSRSRVSAASSSPSSSSQAQASTSATTSSSSSSSSRLLAPTLDDIKITRVDANEDVDASSVIPTSGRAIVVFLTQFGDFDSWELAQRLVDEIPALDQANIPVVAVGIGTQKAAADFARRTNFPADRLYADETGACYSKLGFRPGLARGPKSFVLGPISIDDMPNVSGMTKLLVMCAGIGSPYTLREVFRGYLGDKTAAQTFNDNSNVDLSWKALFNLVGKDYQRPFELATLRLNNMTEILQNWEALAPADDQLLVQRGGSLVIDDGEVIYRHDDPGILGYADASRLARIAKAPRASDGKFDPLPSAEDALKVVHDTAQSRAPPKLAFESLVALEKQRRLNAVPRPTKDDVKGLYRLTYTSGNGKLKDALSLSRTGGGGYFPIPAVQSFDPANERIRNGVYLGPLALFFDGPYVWREKKAMLEFTFDRVSIAFNGSTVYTKEIDGGDWDAVKSAEESVSSGEGAIAKGKKAKVGSQPFFTFFLADDKCVAARGRGGGLAVWRRISDEPVSASSGEYESVPLDK